MGTRRKRLCYRARVSDATPGDASDRATGRDPREGAAVALGFEVEIEVHKWQNAFLVVVMPAGRVEGTGEDLA